MRIRTAIVATLLLLFGATCFAAQPRWEHSHGFRIHLEAAMRNGSILRATVIDRSRGRDSLRRRFSYDIVTLLDIPHYGRVVYKSHMEGTTDGMDAQAQYEFELLDTGETMTISYVTHAGPEAGTYCVTTDSHMSESVEKSSQHTVGPQIREILAGNYSQQFRRCFQLLRAMAYSFPQLELNIAPFEAIYGHHRMVGTQIRFLTPKPIDCSFDAGFGFPCAQDEVPADGRGLSYVSPLKEPPSRPTSP